MGEIVGKHGKRGKYNVVRLLSWTIEEGKAPAKKLFEATLKKNVSKMRRVGGICGNWDSQSLDSFISFQELSESPTEFIIAQISAKLKKEKFKYKTRK